MRYKTLLLSMIIVVFIALTGCGPQPTTPTNGDQSPPTDYQQEEQPQEEIDLKIVQPNELGQVMILMYHQIGPTEGEWTRTPDNFRNDLRRLYENGYRLISLGDYVNNNITTPAGYTPVILTFDDGTLNQFKYIEQDGQLVIDPDSAVGIITEFAKQYRDFGTAATFYVNFPATTFGQREYTAQKLQHLVELGMDIGNHTYSHPYLSRISSQEAEKELAIHVREVQKILPDYSVDSLALPFGLWPKDRSIAVSGQYEGTSYQHNSILLVGANPAPSPISDRFNPLALPRIRGDQNELDKWLNHFEQNPDQRYISDGDPNTITIREDVKEFSRFNRDAVDGKQVRTYALEELE